LIDEATARLLQDRYLDGERGALSGLYAELRFISSVCIKAYCAKKKITKSMAEIDEISHTAASNIIARYLKGDYRIRHFVRTVRDQTVYVLCDGGRLDSPKKCFERGIVSLEVWKEKPVCAPQKSAGGNGRERRAVLDLVRASSFRLACMEIADYMPRQWMYDHVKQLHQIYRMTRGKKERPNHAGPRRPRGSAAAVPGIRPESELRPKLAAEAMEQGNAKGSGR
jgi:hypothetical protein